jgi:hypothetical protein
MELERQYEEMHRNEILSALKLIERNLNGLVGPVSQLIKAELSEKVFEGRLVKILGKTQLNIEKIIFLYCIKSWKLANVKNDLLVKEYLTNIKSISETAYFNSNLSAMNSFLSRTEQGMNLSGRVWNLMGELKLQLEEYIRIGIFTGRSAADISRDIRQLLKEPDKLFRRVRNSSGKLVLSKPAKKFHPGQGVYRSSYKNAMRLASTEVNMSYRMSDHIRRGQLDFVMGIRIHLSKSHPRPDICDYMKGDYPKDFVFRGWHPWCLCFTTSILMSGAEYRKLKIYGIEPKRKLQKIPSEASDYIKNNIEAISRLKSEPYFIHDNKNFFEKMMVAG